MNNSIYNFLYDSVVNTYLIQHCGLRPKDGDQYGLVGKAVHRSQRQQLSNPVGVLMSIQFTLITTTSAPSPSQPSRS